jgi:uncharacterized membrane protein
MSSDPALPRAVGAAAVASSHRDHLRFLHASEHLTSAFGPGWFGERAEAFARFFGTPTFLIGQTVLVVGWMIANSIGAVRFDLYPFILLTLAFSLQAAYAAPLILLAQTRQADRDKATAEADAQHREQIAQEGLERQAFAQHQAEKLQELLEQNTRLTEEVNALVAKINALTVDIHARVAPDAAAH